MQNNDYQTKNPRGSSPPFQVMEQEFNGWMSRLPLIKQTPVQREMQNKELANRISDSVPQKVDEGRRQDDGRELDTISSMFKRMKRSCYGG